MIQIVATDADNDVVILSMTAIGGGNGDEYFIMFPDGKVKLMQSLLGKSGTSYRFNVTVSVRKINGITSLQCLHDL